MKNFALKACAAMSLLAGLCAPAFAAEPALSGDKDIVLHTRDSKTIVIGTVHFTPQGDGAAFRIVFDDKKFTQYFLSMREFKCVEGEEVFCHVPYPYPNPDKVSAKDLSWLEHALLFFYKRPQDYGAKMSHGLIYTFKLTPNGLVGTPQSIDLDEIAVPPDDKSVAFFSGDHRYDIPPHDRWVESVTIRDR
jgi:hypothetical protein